MILAKLTIIPILLVCSSSLIYGFQRPFFIIGHNVYSVKEVDRFLKLGSNVLEFDVRFSSDGSIRAIPCDLLRDCDEEAVLADYLEYIRNLTDPFNSTGYNKQLVMLLFDLNLRGSRNKTRSGEAVLHDIILNLWSRDESRKQEVF